MKIPPDQHDIAAKGMKQKTEEFVKLSSQLYRKARFWKVSAICGSGTCPRPALSQAWHAPSNSVSPTAWSLRRNLIVEEFAERDYVCLADVASFLRFFQSLWYDQMNSLIAHVINSRRGYTVIDCCQKQRAVKLLHCHLFPALAKSSFCREHHRFLEHP